MARDRVARFRNADSRFLARKLVTAVDSMDNPAAGFDAWKSFHETGNGTKLRTFLLNCNIRSGTFQRFADIMIAEHDAASAERPSWGRRLMRSANLAVGDMLIQQVDGMPKDTAAIYGAMESGRTLLCSSDDLDGDALGPLLDPYLDQLVVNRLVSSLEDLRSVANQPIASVSDSQAEALTEQLTAKLSERFDLLARQLTGADVGASTRRALSVGPFIPTDSKFGVDCEGHLLNSDPATKQATFLSRLMVRIGLPVSAIALLPKIDTKFEKWRLVLDSSVRNPLNFTGPDTPKDRIMRSGVEIVSPILVGTSGAIDLWRALNGLKDVFVTNDSCGFHVHSDMEGATLQEVKNLVTAFVKNERKFDQFIDPQRRGNNSHFARSVAGVSLSEVAAAPDISALVNVVNGGDRNSKLDITKLAVPESAQTVQYRAEGGPGYLETAIESRHLV